MAYEYSIQCLEEDRAECQGKMDGLILQLEAKNAEIALLQADIDDQQSEIDDMTAALAELGFVEPPPIAPPQGG